MKRDRGREMRQRETEGETEGETERETESEWGKSRAGGRGSREQSWGPGGGWRGGLYASARF